MQKTVEDMSVRVHVVKLGGTDWTSSAGKMLLAMFSAFAEMERGLIVERTDGGPARAKASGKKLGRPSKTSSKDPKEVHKRYYGTGSL